MIDKANKTLQDDKVKEKRQRKEKRSYSPDERYSSKESKINYNNVSTFELLDIKITLLYKTKNITQVLHT